MSKLFPEYDQYDAVGLAELVRKKAVSPDELLNTALAVAAEVDPKIRALCHVDEAAARACIARGLPGGPFTGVPFLLKDIIAATDYPSSSGSRFFADQKYTYDTETVSRMRKSGLVFFGRTTTPELAFSPTTEAAVYGAPTRNPWDLSRSVGGSSGGAGAAVAAGIVPMAHGSDGGGSIRQPASANGVVGLKPTRARLPAGPTAGEGWAGLLNEGVLSRSVRDTATFLDATNGADPGAPYFPPPPLIPYREAIARPPRKLRMGLLTRCFDGIDVDPEIAGATREVGRLCESLGHIVEDATPKVDYWKMMREFVTIVCCGIAMAIDERTRALGRQPKADELEPVIWSAYEVGKRMPALDYLSALSAGHRVSREAAPFFEIYDALITPVFTRNTARIGEFPGTLQDVMEFRLGERGAARYAAFALLANVTGQPAISLPLTWSASMPSIPIGTQFIGRYGEEDVLLALSEQLAGARPWFNKRPPIVPTGERLASIRIERARDVSFRTACRK